MDHTYLCTPFMQWNSPPERIFFPVDLPGRCVESIRAINRTLPYPRTKIAPKSPPRPPGTGPDPICCRYLLGFKFSFMDFDITKSSKSNAIIAFAALLFAAFLDTLAWTNMKIRMFSCKAPKEKTRYALSSNCYPIYDYEHHKFYSRLGGGKERQGCKVPVGADICANSLRVMDWFTQGGTQLRLSVWRLPLLQLFPDMLPKLEAQSMFKKKTCCSWLE